MQILSQTRLTFLALVEEMFMLLFSKSEETPAPQERQPFSSYIVHTRRKKLTKRTLGRDPNDTIGTVPPYEVIHNRTWDIFWFFCCCGFILNLLDHCYSAITHQERVIGEGRKPQPGIDHLSSLYISSCLAKPNDYKLFLNRYYDLGEVYTLPAEKQKVAMDNIMDLLYRDTVSRSYRKDKGNSVIAWTATLLGLMVAIVEFSRNIIEHKSSHTYSLEIIGYVEGAIGLFGLLVTHITIQSIQVHAKAAASLEDLQDWLDNDWKEKHRMGSIGINPDSLRNKLKSHVTSIKDQLVKLNYTIGSSQDLMSAVNYLRRKLDFPLMRDDDLKIERPSHNTPETPHTKRRSSSHLIVSESSSNSESSNTDSEGEPGRTINDVSMQLDCIIFLVSEVDMYDGVICQIFNDKQVMEDTKENADIETPFNPTQPLYMILYTNESGSYSTVLPPKSVNDFNLIKSQLLGLSAPSTVCSDGDDFLKVASLSTRSPRPHLYNN